MTLDRPLKSPSRIPVDADYFEKSAAKNPAALKSRDTVIKDPNAPADLRFISTPKDYLTPDGVAISPVYAYDSRGRAGQRIIVIDYGVKVSHSEFQRRNGPSAIEGFIFGLDADEENDPTDPSGTSTSRATKMVGRFGGVAKNARLLIVKVAPQMSSFFDALDKIVNFLDDFVLGDIRGYNTMTLSFEWEPDPVTNAMFEYMMQRLMDHYQIVVVVGTGVVGRRPNDGPFPWSGFGSQVTIAAPGVVQVAPDLTIGETAIGLAAGSEPAAALVAGTVAYFLSLELEGMSIRRNPTLTVPQAMISFLKDTARIQHGRNSWGTIWNLLGP